MISMAFLADIAGADSVGSGIVVVVGPAPPTAVGRPRTVRTGRPEAIAATAALVVAAAVAAAAGRG